MDKKNESYYMKNLIRFRKYYQDNKDKKVEYQREYTQKKNEMVQEMKERLINYDIVIRPPRKNDKIGIVVKHGEFIVNWD
jgi:hypothetical protein